MILSSTILNNSAAVPSRRNAITQSAQSPSRYGLLVMAERQRPTVPVRLIFRMLSLKDTLNLMKILPKNHRFSLCLTTAVAKKQPPLWSIDQSGGCAKSDFFVFYKANSFSVIIVSTSLSFRRAAKPRFFGTS